MTTSHNPNPQTIVAFYIRLGFKEQGQRLWRVDVRTVSRLSIDQTMQQVQHMRLGRYALIQSQFHSPDDDLLIVMKHQSEDVGHLPITTGAAKHLVLQSSKSQRQFQNGAPLRRAPACAG